MKKIKLACIAVFAMFTGYNIYNSQRSDILSDLYLDDIEAEAHTIGCESSSGSVLYYCIDWSVVTICNCATSHSGHAKSSCPNTMC